MPGRIILATAIAGAGALLAWLLWPRAATTTSPGASRERTAATDAPRLVGPPRGDSPASERTRSPEGITEIRVATFGEPPREVLFRVLNGEDPPAPTVRIRAKPGERIRLSLSGAAVSETCVDMPDPVPPRVDVRVPARDDARLLEPVLLVVDERSGMALPGAVLDPGPAAPEVEPVPADAEGRIRVPRALAERIRVHDAYPRGGAVVAERDHFPKAWASLVRMGQTTAAAWAEWDAGGAMRVRLEPFPTDEPVPRRSFRLTGENGEPRAGCLVLMRTGSMELLGRPAMPFRADASGRVEVIAPSVAAYDVYDGATLVGTFVISLAATPADTPRSLRIPATVRVHVVVAGLPRPRPDVWLHGPDVLSMEADDLTGWARIDGEIQPGWKSFERAAGGRVEVADGLPAEMDVQLPRLVPVALDVAGRQAVLRVERDTTVEIDWGALPATPRDRGSVVWSATREGLDDVPGGLPSAARPK